MTLNQAKKLAELMKMGYKSLGPVHNVVGGDVLVQAPDDKKFVVGSDGKLTPVADDTEPDPHE